MGSADAWIRTLFPPLCPVCGRNRSGDTLIAGGPCADCHRTLTAAPPGTGPLPPGLDWVVAGFRHDGLPRRALAALKFERRTALAGPLASLIASRTGGRLEACRLVPVPSSRIGRRLRGFDPAGSIAAELAALTGLPPPLDRALVRTEYGRQRGRDRRERLAGGSRFEARHDLTGPIALVDDVVTTGATLSACAMAVRAVGAGPVGAVAVTRRA